ncbi:MAG: hypothetical protein ACRCY4_05930 [Brevinema sp.]
MKSKKYSYHIPSDGLPPFLVFPRIVSDLITKWENHIIALLDNPKTFDLSSIQQEPENTFVFQDIMRFILLTLYFEVPHNYKNYLMYQEYQSQLKDLGKHTSLFIEQLSFMNTYLKKNERFLFGGLKYQKRDSQSNHDVWQDFQNASQGLVDYLQHPTGLLSVNNLDFEPKRNALLNREINSEAGFRNLAIRYVALCIQIAFNGKSPPKSNIPLIIYKISKYILNTEDFYLDITREVFDKTIRFIDINNPKQCYAGAFNTLSENDTIYLECSHGLDTDPHKKTLFQNVQKWEKASITYAIRYNFSKRQKEIFPENSF